MWALRFLRALNLHEYYALGRRATQHARTRNCDAIKKTQV